VATIKVDNIYLRSGPDIRFEPVALYKKGDQFTLLGRYQDWFQAENDDGNLGWLYKDWLTLPASSDLEAMCLIAGETLPSAPNSQTSPQQNNQNDSAPANGGACVPSYYDPCK
jgi:uncharacterized protein YgiM (DUF1202 family)